MLLADRVRVLERLAELIEEHADDLARLETLQTGSAYKLRRDSDLAFASDNLRFFAGQVRHLDGKAALRVLGQPHELRSSRAPRRRRAGGALELPALDGDLEGRAGARGRQLGRAQASNRHAAHDGAPRGACARGGASRRGPQRRHRTRRHRRGCARCPHGRRPDFADRRYRDGQADPGARVGQPEAGPSRARWQGAVHRLRRCRHRGSRPRCHRRCADQRRPGLHGGNARLRAQQRPRCVRPANRRAVRFCARRRPVRSGDGSRDADLADAGGARRRVRRAGTADRCADRRRADLAARCRACPTAPFTGPRSSPM